VLRGENGRVSRSGLIVDFQDVGDGRDAAQSFQDVMDWLVSRYGRPAMVAEEGDFGPGFRADVNSGSLIRVYEWRLAGGVLRFGIPRRLDGAVRMEAQFAPSFPAAVDTLWSFEEVP
jgi:hypothetical protein